MPRKRKTTTPVAEPEMNAATITAEPPAHKPVEQIAPQPTPAAQPSAASTATFADRVGQRIQRPSIADPFLIAFDNAAGVRLFENKRARVMAIKFEGRPSQDVLALVKDAGYRWNQDDRVWTHAVREDSAMATRIDAELLYQETRKMIRQDKGMTTGQEIPL